MDYLPKIFDILNLPNTTTLYIGVGTGMGHYAEVTEENNQQYPCFLNKFPGSHLVVLFDPYMESNLKLFDYFDSQEDPLNLVYQTNWDTIADRQYVSEHWTDEIKNTYPNATVPKCRQYINSRGTFFIINDYFYSQLNYGMNKLQINKVSECFSILCQMITIALSKVKPSKIIYQDYTGLDTTNLYNNLLEVFGREALLPYVCFDVTQNDGGCLIELKPNMIQLDDSDNFFQEKYKNLTKISHSPKYLQILKSRIDVLTYPTIWNYIKLRECANFKQISVNSVKNLAIIYEQDFDILASHDTILHQYLSIITIVIRDIVRSREIDDSIANYLLENLENRTEFINTMSMLKFE